MPADLAASFCISLLLQMDGFEENSGIVVMAATNIPESLDPALTRPGRRASWLEAPLLLLCMLTCPLSPP